MKTLKETGVLTFTDYLSSLSDSTVAQGIITDVIDVDEMRDFFIDVITSSVSSDIMRVHFDECFKTLISDVIERPELIKHDLFASIESKLPDPDMFQNCIVVKFVNELLSRESHQNIVDLSMIIGTQREWNVNFKEEKFQVLTRILQQLSNNHSERIAKLLIDLITRNHKINWFFLLMIVNHLKRTTAVIDVINSEFEGSKFNSIS